MWLEMGSATSVHNQSNYSSIRATEKNKTLSDWKSFGNILNWISKKKNNNCLAEVLFYVNSIFCNFMYLFWDERNLKLQN